MGFKLISRAPPVVSTQARRHRRTWCRYGVHLRLVCIVSAAPALTTSQPRLAAQPVHGGQLGGVAPEVVDARGRRED